MRRLGALLIILSVACGAEKDPAVRTLNAIEEGIESRDTDDVIEHIADSFHGADGTTRQQIAEELKRYFFAYDKLSVSISGLTTKVVNDYAQADFDVLVLGSAKKIGGLDQLMPSSTRLKMHVELAKSGNDWKVVAARWQRLD